MFEAFAAWVEAILGPTYRYSAGMWVDSTADAGSFICSIHQLGGPPVDVEDRRQRFRVILLGPRGGRQHNGAVRAASETLVSGAIAASLLPCGASNIRAITEPSGPGYTTETRAWFSVDFEVLF